jgi:hypothetical protein
LIEKQKKELDFENGTFLKINVKKFDKHLLYYLRGNISSSRTHSIVWSYLTLVENKKKKLVAITVNGIICNFNK